MKPNKTIVFSCFIWFSFVFLDGESNLIINLLNIAHYEKGNMVTNKAL